MNSQQLELEGVGVRLREVENRSLGRGWVRIGVGFKGGLFENGGLGF